MKFEVVVPVLFPHNFGNFFDSVMSNDVLPTRLIVIDNTSGEENFIPKTDRLKIDVYRSKTGWVNESWNLGMKRASKDADYLGIYNDDIILNKRFFRRVVETFNRPMRYHVGVVCPDTVPCEGTEAKQPKWGKFSRVWMRKREGWCFTMKREVRINMPLIPCHLVHQFHGDDWIWYHTKLQGFSWFKDQGNKIWHLCGESVRKVDANLNRRIERHNWRIIHDLLEAREFEKIKHSKRVEKCQQSMEQQLMAQFM